MRNILADKPRVTKFPVEFDPPPDDMVLLAGSAEAAADDAATDMLQNGASRGGAAWVSTEHWEEGGPPLVVRGRDQYGSLSGRVDSPSRGMYTAGKHRTLCPLHSSGRRCSTRSMDSPREGRSLMPRAAKLGLREVSSKVPLRVP